MSFRKILCPIDFSPGSDPALRIAAALATSSQCELVVSHAWFVPRISYTTGEWMIAPELVERLMEDDERGLGAAVLKAKSAGVKRVTPLLHVGPPAEQIVHTLREDHAFDLCVVGTRGRTGFGRVLLGSVAESVVRHAPCAVLAARATPAASDRVRSILCPVDFSESSALALDRAAELIEPGGAGITVFHATDLPSSYSGDLTLPDANAELDRLASAAVERLVTKLRARVEVPVKGQTAMGRPGRAILELLEREPFDLVVMGSHGRTGLRRIFLGSVAEATVRHAPCPVFIARVRES